MNYRIIHRGYKNKYNEIDNPDTENDDGQFDDRDYNKPLCGISNLSDDLKIGDIIGVKLQIEYKEDYFFPTKFLKQEYSDLYSNIPIKSEPIMYTEEHLFRIISILDNNSFNVEKVYLDNKIIIHEYYKNVDTWRKVNKDHITEYDLIDMFYCGKIYYSESDGFCTQCTDWTKFKSDKIKDCLNDLRHATKKGVIRGCMATFNRYAISKSYKYFYSENNDWIKDYYDIITKNMDIIEKYFTTEEIESIGTYEKYLYEYNNKTLYNIIYGKMPELIDYNLEISDFEEHQYEAYLGNPKIIHNIDKINYSDIYRVYKKDPNYHTKKTTTISDRCGNIYNEEVRKLIKVGDIVRLPIYINVENKEERVNNDAFNWRKKWHRQSYCTYFNIIMLNGTKFLGILTYTDGNDSYEDIIIESDIHNISELYKDIPELYTGNSVRMTGLGDNEQSSPDDNIDYNTTLSLIN